MTDKFDTKDSGQRRTFETGARRDQATGKGRWDLLNWDMIERDAQLLERGALKYDDNNWKRGIPLKSFQDSAARHLSQLIRGDRSEDHSAAARWNISGFEWTRARILEGKLPRSLATGTFVEHELVPTPSVLRQPDDFAETAGPTKRRADPKGNRRKVPWLVGFETSPKPWRLRGDDGRTCTRVKGIRREGRRETDPEFK
jgi:hypothetical protein